VVTALSEVVLATGWTGAWLDEARRWRAPDAGAGSGLWPLLLGAGFPHGLLDPPAATVDRYRRVWWDQAPPPDGEGEVRARVAWIEPHEGGSDVAIETTYRRDDLPVAGSTWVLRVPTTLPAMSAPVLPPAPGPFAGGAVQGRRVVRADAVATCASLLGRHSPLTESVGYASAHGYPANLVPGLLLFLQCFDDRSPWPTSGDLEVWFRGPVTVGAIIERVLDPARPDEVGLRMVGRSRLAVQGRRRYFVAG
jgi:hypothetical protein